MLRINKPFKKEKLTDENIVEFYKTVCNYSIWENECINVHKDFFDDMIHIVVFRDLFANLTQQLTIYIYLHHNYFSIECYLGNRISGLIPLDYTPVLISDYQCSIFF